jgi:hypothetical protein
LLTLHTSRSQIWFQTGVELSVSKTVVGRVGLIGLGIGICLTVGLTTLVLSTTLSPHGVVYGSVHTCRISITMNNDACYARIRYAPMAGSKVRFVGVSDRPLFIGTTFMATTDTNGDYSISLPAGHYLLPGYFDGAHAKSMSSPARRWKPTFRSGDCLNSC